MALIKSSSTAVALAVYALVESFFDEDSPEIHTEIGLVGRASAVNFWNPKTDQHAWVHVSHQSDNIRVWLCPRDESALVKFGDGMFTMVRQPGFNDNWEHLYTDFASNQPYEAAKAIFDFITSSND